MKFRNLRLDQKVLLDAEREAQKKGKSVEEVLAQWCSYGHEVWKDRKDRKTNKSKREYEYEEQTDGVREVTAILKAAKKLLGEPKSSGSKSGSSQDVFEEGEDQSGELDLDPTIRPDPSIDFSVLRVEKRINKRFNYHGTVVLNGAEKSGLLARGALKDLSLEGCGVMVKVEDKKDIDSLIGLEVQIEITSSTNKSLGILKGKVVRVANTSHSPQIPNIEWYVGVQLIQPSAAYRDRLVEIMEESEANPWRQAG